MDVLPNYHAVCSFVSIVYNVLFCLAFNCVLACLLALQTSFLGMTIILESGPFAMVFLPNCFLASWSIVILSFILSYCKCCKLHFSWQIHCSESLCTKLFHSWLIKSLSSLSCYLDVTSAFPISSNC